MDLAAARAVMMQPGRKMRSEEHTSELQSRPHLVCRLLLEKKKNRLRTGEQRIPNTSGTAAIAALLASPPSPPRTRNRHQPTGSFLRLSDDTDSPLSWSLGS